MTATTTRYWDCSGGACGCSYVPNGLNNPADPAHCPANALFRAPANNPHGATFYGAAAISRSLGGGDWMAAGCGKCWKVVGTSNVDGFEGVTTTLVLKGTNFCPDANPACAAGPHFDIAAPGFDVIQFSLSHRCPYLHPEEDFTACSTWLIGSSDPNANCDCGKLNNPVLRAGCDNFFSLKWDNPLVEYNEVACPEELSRLHCGYPYPDESVNMPETCASNAFDGPVPTLPPVTFPTATLPPVTFPTATLPPVTFPTTTLPPASLPPVTFPTATLPPVTFPTATLPPVTFPTTTLPPVTFPTATLPPAPLPPATGSGGSCFSEQSEVVVEGKGVTCMDALKIGDSVLTADGFFSKVYSFGHRASSFKTTYLQVFAASMEQGHPLEISSEHMIYTHDTAKDALKIVAAGDIEVGDSLLTKEGLPSEILWIRKVERQGVYSPLTESGNLLVNGVLASSYVSRNWLKDHVSGDTLHAFQHGSTLPVRLFCSVVSCQQESYHKKTGFSNWVQFWFDVEQWMLSLPTAPQVSFLFFLAVPSTVILLVGKVLGMHLPVCSWWLHALVAAVGYFVWKRQFEKGSAKNGVEKDGEMKVQE